eukprot:CAMPEP_0119471646 /NCGR_PEP_ID=MMETSP1344-20130328/4025_1 /TAXON_ID=236787 /ORGANISM="Florenciella parvula, Strain CCMP2471" /LENGTH=201 /DNA_ID=CAMNT_0007504455 /DNA_START=1 /DNA_END=606 /DNA_ORIENTATION=+
MTAASREQTSMELEELTASIILLKETLKEPLDSKVRKRVNGSITQLGKLAAADPFVKAISGSLVHKTCKDGFPTVAQLKDSFDLVQEASRREYFVPDVENAWFLSGALGRSIGFVRSQFSASFKVPLEDGKSAEDVLARMAKHLADGHLEKAVSESKLITGRAAIPMKDWLADANARLVADQATKALYAHGSILNLKQSPR